METGKCLKLYFLGPLSLFHIFCHCQYSSEKIFERGKSLKFYLVGPLSLFLLTFFAHCGDIVLRYEAGAAGMGKCLKL